MKKKIKIIIIKIENYNGTCEHDRIADRKQIETGSKQNIAVDSLFYAKRRNRPLTKKFFARINVWARVETSVNNGIFYLFYFV